MKTPEDYFEVEFAGTDDGGKRYTRTILCLGVPRVGDEVQVDNLFGVVRTVMWRVTNGKPNGRSVLVIIGP